MALDIKDLEVMVDKYSKAYNECNKDLLRLQSMWDRLKAFVASKSKPSGLNFGLFNSNANEILLEMEKLEKEK